MKLFNHFLGVAVLAISLCSQFAFAETDCNLEPICALETDYVLVNKNNEMIFPKLFWENGNQFRDLFYTNIELSGEELNVTKIVGNHLLQAGYAPKSFSSKSDCKPWDCEYYLDYGIRQLDHNPNSNSGIDDFGNVLLLFTCEKNYIKTEGLWLYNLGVWNKDYGFKVIDTPGIDNVVPKTFSNGECLFVVGRENKTSKTKTLVIPIKAGYWGERVQAEPEGPVKEPLSEKTWWDQVKPKWWS